MGLLSGCDRLFSTYKPHFVVDCSKESIGELAGVVFVT